MDTLHWLTPTSVLIGTAMVEEEEEEGRSPMLVLRWEQSGQEGPTAFSLTEFAAYPSSDVGIGSALPSQADRTPLHAFSGGSPLLA